MNNRTLLTIIISILYSLAAKAVPETPPLAKDGWYEVSKPSHLEWLSDYVNQGNTRLNIRLMNDLDMSEVENFTPIGLYTDTGGLTSRSFSGIFDGQYHIIYNLNVLREDTYETGLFSRINGGGTLENLGIVNANIVNKGKTRSGVFAGEIHLSTVRNCFSAGYLMVSTEHAQKGGLAGECYDSNIYNTYTTMDKLADYGSYTNCYTGADMAESGEMCWLLNGGTAEDPFWFQTIGVDKYPVWNSMHGVVYKQDDGTFASIYDTESFVAYRDGLLQDEFDYLNQVVATQSLVDRYRTSLQKLTEIDIFSDFDNQFKALASQRKDVETAALAYAQYQAKIENVRAYLQKNPGVQGPDRDFLEGYLSSNEGPGTYPHGGYLYVYEHRLLSAIGINSETQYVQTLLGKAIANGYGEGAEVTDILQNPDFMDGTNGWHGKLANEVGGTDAMRVVASNYAPCDMYQTLTGLSNGIYLLEVNGAFCPSGMSVSTHYASFLYANEQVNCLQTVVEDYVSVSQAENGVNCQVGSDIEVSGSMGTLLGYGVHSVDGGALAFAEGRYVNAILTRVTDGTLNIGVRTLGTENSGDWTGWGNIHLTYCGDLNSQHVGEALDKVLASQGARAQTLLAYQGIQGVDCVFYPNYSLDLRNSLREALDACETLTTAEDKYAMIETLSTLFLQIYDCKMAYRKMGQTMNQTFNSNNTFDSSDGAMAELEELYGSVWDGYYNGTFSTEEALRKAQDIFSDYPSYLRLSGSRAKNAIDMTQTGLFSFHVETLGSDPYISTSYLTADLDKDQTVICFEYRSQQSLQGGEFFFAEPLQGGREQQYQDLPPADDWTFVFIDIAESRKKFNWGYEGNWLRWDPVAQGRRSIDFRNLRIISPLVKEDIITEVPNVLYLTLPTMTGVYNLKGQQLRPDNSLQGLPNGIYIMEGKKVVK